jgi:hypothetical protein
MELAIFVGSFALGDFMPGVYSAPLLIITSTYLLWSTKRLKTTKKNYDYHRSSCSPKIFFKPFGKRFFRR